MRRDASASAIASVFLTAVLAGISPPAAFGAGSSRDEPAALSQIKHEIDELRADRERDLKHMQLLEHQVEEIQKQNDELKSTNSALQIGHQKLQAETTQEIKQLQTKVASSPSESAFGSAMSRYLGSHQTVITGSGAGNYVWDRSTAKNTFGAQFEPILLYRLNDWLLFESEIEAELPSDAESELKLESAMAHVFLNDYAELVLGKFFLPFGDFIEDVHPFWVNPFVTLPLPFREGDDGGLLPFTDLGAQLRGAFQWGDLGQDADYALWLSNGPGYDPDLPTPVVGQMFGANNIDVNKHSKAFGTRVRFYPFPLDSELGRLEVGASTYDSKWGFAGVPTDQWLTSWGVDFNYLRGNLGMRGEYLATHRQMPGNAAADNRQGWYFLARYQLADLRPSFISTDLQNLLHRAELLIRYSGQNQRALAADEIPTAPAGSGSDVSPSTFLPHPREVALGIDYWFTPSIVWKLEYDMELPRAGGSLTGFGPTGLPFSTPVGATVNDRAIETQFAIGF